MAEGRGGAQGQKFRISLGLPVGAVSLRESFRRLCLIRLETRLCATVSVPDRLPRSPYRPPTHPHPPLTHPPPSPSPHIPRFPSVKVINCGDNSGAKNLFIMAVTQWGARMNRLPAACVGDFCLGSVKKGKPELRKKGA